MIGPPVLRRRILKGSGQPDRERAAVLMEGGGNAFMSYMNFGDEQGGSACGVPGELQRLFCR